MNILRLIGLQDIHEDTGLVRFNIPILLAIKKNSQEKKIIDVVVGKKLGRGKHSIEGFCVANCKSQKAAK